MGPKKKQKKEAVLSTNDDFGKLSKFLENEKKDAFFSENLLVILVGSCWSNMKIDLPHAM